MGVPLSHLTGLYSGTDDPWNFRSSAYEAAKFAATVRALPRPAYRHCLELGCGNGELARRLAAVCEAYTGLDAVDTVLDAARLAVPHGRFVQGYLPCPLPAGAYDLVVLSEILYFLDPPTLAGLAQQVDSLWPAADVIAVSWCGPSGNDLEGGTATEIFARSTRRAAVLVPGDDPSYRIDLFRPLDAIR